MANYHKETASVRSSGTRNAQSFKDIKKLVAENPGLGWKVMDNIIHNCVTIYSFTHDVMRIMPHTNIWWRAKTVFSSFQLNLLNSCNESDESRKW